MHRRILFHGRSAALTLLALCVAAPLPAADNPQNPPFPLPTSQPISPTPAPESRPPASIVSPTPVVPVVTPAATPTPAPVVPPPGQVNATLTTSSGVPVTISTGAPSTRVPVRRPVGDTPVSGITLKFDNAEIYEVIQTVLGDILRLDYALDPSIQGRVTLNTTAPVSMADVYNVLEGVLSLNGISIVRDGKVYKVVRDANAVRDAVSFEAAGENSPLIQIIPVKFVQASQLVNSLRNFIGTQAAMTSDPTNHYLIVADRATNVAKIVDMVKVLDVDYLRHVRIRMVQLEKGDATEMAREMDILFRASGMFNWAGTDGNKVFFLPVVRMNAVLVAAANDAVLAAAEQWIRTLDDEPKNGLGNNVHVYPVANSNAAHIANILRQLYGGAAAYGTQQTTPATGATSQPGQTSAVSGANPTQTITRGNVPGATAAGAGLAGTVQIIADEATNTLVIRASAPDYQQIRKVIERLDTIPRQVLIQVMVAEVSLTDKLQYGIEWWMKSVLSKDGKTWPALLGIEGNLIPPTSPGTVSGAASGLNYLVFNGAGSIVGMLKLLADDTDVSLLSAPHVMASDGKTAKIEVGADEPIVTQTVSTPSSIPSPTATGLTTSNSVQYRPTGILLDVKPSINASGRVTLSITQEVSARGTPLSVGGSEYPSFSKRKVSTDVTLEEGKTLMIAGLIQDKGTRGVIGVPGLKDIPLLGMLFGTTKNDRDKVELMIAITPYVVRNREEGDRITAAFQDSLRDLKGLMQNHQGGNYAPRLDRQTASEQPATGPQ